MNHTVPVFDYKICMACRVCVMECPFSCIDMTRSGPDPYGKVYPELARPEDCTGCGLCGKACPVDCITMA